MTMPATEHLETALAALSAADLAVQAARAQMPDPLGVAIYARIDTDLTICRAHLRTVRELAAHYERREGPTA